MPLSDVDLQLLIVQQVGDVDPQTGDPVLPTQQGSTGIVMSNITRLWAAYADKASTVSPRLRALYVTRDAYDLTIAVLEKLVDFTALDGSYRVSLSQRVRARQQQRAEVLAEIERIERQQLAAIGPVVGPLSTVEPIAPPTWGSWPPGFQPGHAPDASSPVYGGSPYWRSRRRRW